MSSSSENSFGARLRRAQDLATYIVRFPNYNPPRSEEMPEEFNVFLNTINQANIDIVSIRQNYNTAITMRYNLFRKDNNCLIKMLAPLRGYVLAQYGKNSIEFNQIDAIITKIRSGKVIKTLASDGTTETKVSQSEQSYGSLTQYFGELVIILQGFKDYNPSRNELQITNLQKFLANINTLNNTAAVTYQSLKTNRDARQKSYKELHDRAQRIKAYIKANYGTSSTQYNLVKGMKI